MLTLDLLAPWLRFAAVLIPLLYVQRWIHRHLFGVGFLLSKEKHAATLAYYLFLFPGVILHEFSHYFLAYSIGYNVKKFEPFPHAQEDGSLEMGFVQLDEIKNPVFALIIGVAPLITGLIAVTVISNSMLGLPAFINTLGTADITIIGDAFGKMISHPDFWIWTYILFGIANAMMPGREEWRGWWALTAGFCVLLFLLIIFGAQVIAANVLKGPVTTIFNSLTTVFGVVLFLDCCAVGVIFVMETILIRVTGHRVDYQPALAAGAKAKALPAKSGPVSIYELDLPLPPAPGKDIPAKSPLTPAPALAARPALGASSPARPAVPAGTPNLGGLPKPTAPPALPGESKPDAKPEPARPAFGTSKPAEPVKPAASTGTTGTPKPGEAPRPAFGMSKPAEPAKPAASVGSTSKPGEAKPISGPPALRPATPPTPAPKPGFPAPAAPASLSPAPKPSFGAPPRPSEGQRPRFNAGKDDIIDADVVEDDENDQNDGIDDDKDIDQSPPPPKSRLDLFRQSASRREEDDEEADEDEDEPDDSDDDNNDDEDEGDDRG